MFEWDDFSVAGFIGFCAVLPYILEFLGKLNAEQLPKVITIEKPVIKYKYINTTNSQINKPIKNNNLFEDCIQCLVSLGMNKKNAKQKTEEMFLTKSYISIENFLLDVYKK